MTTVIVLLVVVVVGGLATFAYGRWGGRWGATAEECQAAMAGDEWLAGGPSARVSMTRAITIAAPPEVVWPWLAQLGRGAGWYSYDRLDNGGRPSARHLVSWIPAPRLGDASAIGYLRHLDEGRDLAWWMPGETFLGAAARMVSSSQVRSAAGGSRVIIRMSGDAAGRTAWLITWLFPVVDSLMARRQLLGLRDRVEHPGDGAGETGARDQYQLFEAVYADGERAGVPGREQAARFHEAAAAAGLVR